MAFQENGISLSNKQSIRKQVKRSGVGTRGLFISFLTAAIRSTVLAQTMWNILSEEMCSF